MIGYSTEEVDVSIIIPFFNNHLTIQETLDSLENQEFKNFEVILVEDKNSNHLHPKTISKRYTFNFLYLKNDGTEGASANRNLGIKAAKGKYLQFLDSDDLISNDKLFYQVELIKTHKNTLVIGRWGVFEKSILEYKNDASVLYKNWHPANYLAQLNGEFNMLMPLHSYLIPKNLINAAGLWDETVSLGDDGEFMNRVIAECEQLLFSDTAISYYRRGNTSSLSHQMSKKSAESNYRCAKSYENLILAKYPNNQLLIKSIIRKYNLLFYWSYQRFPVLANDVEHDVKRLGGKIDMTIGSSISKLGQRLLGVKLYLKLTHQLFLR